MRIPIIKVRSEDGHEHIVGENQHDLLYVDENGALQYMNSHCSEGTKYGAYAFVGVTAKDDEYSVTGRPEIGFVTLEQLIELEAEHIKKQVNHWAKLRQRIDEESKKMITSTRAGLRTPDDAESEKITKKDIPLIDPIVCPVKPDAFFSATSETFMSFMNGVVAKIRDMNEKGNLRMMKNNKKTCDYQSLYEFDQRVFDTEKGCILYYSPIHSNDLFDPDPEYELKIEEAYPLLTRIIVKGDADVINNMAHDNYDRPYLAVEIKVLMEKHYYSDDMVSRFEDAFETYIRTEKEKQKKDMEKRIADRLEALKAEGKAIYEKYGVRFEYGYAVHIRLLYGNEKMTGQRWYDGTGENITPEPMFFAKLVLDKDYSKRKEKFENIEARINAARATAGNRTIMSYYIYHSRLKEFMNDSELTRKENPDKKTVAYIDENTEGTKKPLSHWTLVDVACCNDALFNSLLEAMREYVKSKGLNMEFT